MKIVNARRRGAGITCPSRRLLPAAHLWAGLLLALILGIPAYGQNFHGASIQKVPVGPSGIPQAHVGDPIIATIRVRNLDDFEDSITVTSIVDVVHHNAGDVTTTNLLAAPVT